MIDKKKRYIVYIRVEGKWKMEAEKLRIGEKQRDASTKIRGFLYQDLLTLKLLTEFSAKSKVFSEWVEDIYIENNNDIHIIQAKYYPSSKVKFSEIFEDMYFQSLKVKLYKIKKNVFYSCYYYGDTKFNKESCANSFSHKFIEKELSDDERVNLIKKLKKCSNMHERKDLIFSNMNMHRYMDAFNLQTIKTETIGDLYANVKDALFNEFKDIGILSYIDRNQAKEVIISIFTTLVQSKYHTGSEFVNDRYLDKSVMQSYLKTLLETEDKFAYEALIIAVIDNVIDQIYMDVLDETVDNQETLNEYEKISSSTKNFFRKFLETRENRYKLINTISMESYDVLNFQKYNDLTYHDEYLLFIENKLKINSFIKTLWKIVFSLNSKPEIKEVLRANSDYIEFCHESESGKLVLLSSEFSSDATREYKKFLKRVQKYKTRPQKWYMRNCKKGNHDYEFYQRDIDIDRDQFDISKIENDNSFRVECMKCIKCDYKQMDIKDNLDGSIFNDRCVEDYSDED